MTTIHVDFRLVQSGDVFRIMRSLLRHSLALLFSWPWAHALPAEDAVPVPVPVVLRHAGSDPVGFLLAAAVSQAIGAVPEFKTTADTTSPRIVVVLATVDGYLDDPGQQTATSVNILYDADTLPLNGYLITGLVQVCGATRTEACAQEIVTTLTAAIDRVRTSYPDLWLALQPQP